MPGRAPLGRQKPLEITKVGQKLLRSSGFQVFHPQIESPRLYNNQLDTQQAVCYIARIWTVYREGHRENRCVLPRKHEATG